MSRFSWIVLVLSLLTAAGAWAAEVEHSPRTLRIGIEVDRHGAKVLSYSVKDRPYVKVGDDDPPLAYDSDESVQIEIVLFASDGRSVTRRQIVGPICFDHAPHLEPHFEGDTLRMHRDSFLVELPELAGFDRVEVAYYEKFRGAAVRKSLGTDRLDRSRFDKAGGKLGYEALAFAQASDEPETSSIAASTVIWPEDLLDPDIYRISGNPAEGDRRMNIVIVPDGYTYAEKTAMEQHADDLIAYMRQTPPTQEHDRFINYTLVYAYSVESGTDQCDCGIVVDTAMGTRFPQGNGNCGSSANRCLSYGGGCDDSGTTNIVAAEQRAPFHDETIVMVNTTRYGGCAGSRSTYSAGNSAGEDVGTHELGHSAAGLADEYVSNTGCGTAGGNVNTSTNAVDGAWPEWIADLGAPREGARYWSECIYRPENNCKMRSLYQPFCKVCRQRWPLVLFGHPRVSPTAPVESFSPQPTQVLLDTQLDFSIATRFAQGAGVTNTIVWSVQEPSDPAPVIVATGVQNYSHVFDELGDSVVTCEVVASTNFIKPEKNDGNRDVITWNVESVSTVCEIGCADGIPECDADGDGLGDICDPCPAQALNDCFGPVALDNTQASDIRINTDGSSTESCAGPKTDCRGKQWAADFGANQTGSPVSCDLPGGCPADSTAVFGCTDAQTEDLFRCGRIAPVLPPSADMAYQLDVPDGDYLLNLLFMNPSSLTTNPGDRVLSVSVNGETPVQLQQVDPVALAGASPLSRSAVIAVEGGNGLNIEFSPEIGQPMIQGIELLCKTSLWYRDADDDGFGDAATILDVCYQPPGYVADSTDCNDANATAYPGAEEICDTLDNNCDDQIDEDLDGDGRSVCDDCNELDFCQWDIPTEVLDVEWEGKTRVIFNSPADPGGSRETYTGLRSATPDDFSGAQCLQGSFQVNAVIDEAAPAEGIAWYYLIQAHSSCGNSTLGTGSGGTPRSGPTCFVLGGLGCSDGTGGATDTSPE